MRFAFAVHHLAVIKSLIDNYVDLRMTSIEMAETVRDYVLVDVKDTKNNRTVSAKIDPLDYRMVTDPQYRWRLHSSGYAVSSKKKESVYMHSLVFGGMSTHINGDRMDNRRSNLIKSKRNKVRTCDFVLQGPREPYEYNSTDPDLMYIHGNAVVKYGRNKTYRGQVKQGIPHGNGVLTTDSYDLIGTWEEGKVDSGIHVNYKYPGPCICEHFHLCPLREVVNVELINSGFRLRPGPGHLGGVHQGRFQEGVLEHEQSQTG
jgi:hypothetical protein